MKQDLIALFLPFAIIALAMIVFYLIGTIGGKKK